MQRFWRTGLAFAWLAAAAVPGLALAADPGAIVTQPAWAPPMPVPAAEPAPLGQPLPWWDDLGPLPPNDGKVHGTVSASVGTGGYREGGVSLEGPLPNGGAIAIAVDGVQFDGDTVREPRQGAASTSK